jgi:hypothetical protein
MEGISVGITGSYRALKIDGVDTPLPPKSSNEM